MADPHDDVSQFEAVVRRATPRFTKSHAAKHVMTPLKINVTPVVVPKSPVTPANVPPSDPSPGADPPPPTLSDASEPNLTPPNNPETPVNVTLPNRAPALQPSSSGKSRAKCKSSSTMLPPRHFSRLNKAIPNPTESVLITSESMPNPTESVPNPESVPLIHPVPNPESVPSLNPESVLITSEEVPNPTESVPNPSESVPNPTVSVPNPEEVPNPTESVPSTNVSPPHRVSDQTTPLRRSSRLNTPSTNSQDVPADIGNPNTF